MREVRNTYWRHQEGRPDANISLVRPHSLGGRFGLLIEGRASELLEDDEVKELTQIFVHTHVRLVYNGKEETIESDTKGAAMSSSYVVLFFNVLLATVMVPSTSTARPGGADLECRFQCPATLKPSPRPLHKRSSNGCGTEAFRLPASALPHPDFEACCNEHDLCYDTCLSDKAQCDRSFDACMARICDTKVAVKDSCISTAGLFTTMTKNLGCEAFLKSQEQACICRSEDEL
uniref:Putative salivary phospholipase a2 n=1 Tax=Amblyomma triste TaxID=251400 RepID=A0A023GAG0_AMBTT